MSANGVGGPEFPQPAIESRKHGSTGTGLDAAVDLLGSDYGLNARVSGSHLSGGMAAADAMNALIVQAIRATGVASDGTITTSDVYAINGWIRSNALSTWTALHGDDENGVETGYHMVQNDGAVTRLFAHNAVDTVLDGVYHLGFAIRDGRFLNEDGDANASVEDVATWLSSFLSGDLAAGTLANAAVDPQVHGASGTGLDRLVETIVDDAGLNTEISHTQINAGATAADAMNRIIVAGVRATGVADDGDITALDLRELNGWIRANHLSTWTRLHGDDENGVETGFHLVQNDGGTGYLYGEEAVDTVADGIYHLGFEIKWGYFVNEDGNLNASLEDVATWLSLIMADDLAAGRLASHHAVIDPATLAADRAYALARTVTVDNDAGQYEAGRPAGLALANGTVSLSFVADAPDDGSYQVLFSKDGSSNAAGDISCFLYDGHLYVQMQDGTTTTWLEARDHVIEAGVAYDLAVSFGANGLRISLNGELVALDQEWTTGLSGNARSLLIGAGNWGRDGTNPTATWNHFDGTITNFAIYDRALDAFEIDALSSAPHLSGPSIGAAALAGALPAVRAGTGLAGEVFDRAVAFDDIDALIAQTQTQAAANRHFVASRVDFDSAAHDATTLGAFLGDAATLTDGGATTAMTTLGLRLTGFVHLSAGEHLVTVRSDDGFLLKIGGQVVSSYDWDRGFSGTTQSVVSTGGLYAVELYYFDNQGDQGLRLEIDGELAGPELFYRNLADYEAALAANGAAPAGGLPPVYDGPLGTTGTGLDATIRVIGEDQGLAHRVSRADIAAGAAAADAINGMIVEAIRATGAANDGVLTTAEVYDLSTYIRAHHYAAFLAAHGDDETGVETGYHLVQNDGATTRLYGENAVNTVFDGIYHIGFETEWDRFLNEDGNANARVETVAYWLNDLLKTDLANGTLANPNVDPLPNGSTGTGLDAAVDLIGSDYGLNARVSGSHLSGGMASADAMNALIVQAIRATGVASDGTITTSDVYAINGWIRANALSTWTALHGDDENGVETGYHMVQNDGAVTRLFAHNAVDTVLDGVYHLGFAIRDGRFLNEDGDANASVEDVATWLSSFLSGDLAAGTLANAAVDPQVHGASGTGLDRLVETIVDDAGLNTELSHTQINAGATAADAMNRIIVAGLRATGVADDGDITALDLREVNGWIRANHLSTWTRLHGDDENGVETGFHLVQNDGGAGYLYGEEAVDTVADGIYHLGFEIKWGYFVNEDGNLNASLEDVATWLSLIMADDLAAGRLASHHAVIDPATLAADRAYALARTVTVDNDAGQYEAGRPAGLALANGTVSLSFVADAPDDGSYQVLFSKDGSSNAAGDISCFLYNGHLYVQMQDGTTTTWLEARDHVVEAGVAYDLAVSFGANGLRISLNGELVALDQEWTTGLSGNARSLLIGAGNWGRDGTNPTATWNHFDGTISNFAIYDRALDAFEIDALSSAPHLSGPSIGAAALAGALPAVRAGTGLAGEVFDRAVAFDDIDALIAQTQTQAAANRHFVASRIDFDSAAHDATTLGAFLGDAATLTDGGATTAMTTLGLRLTGFVHLSAGEHLVTVRSDDGFLLKIGGQVVSSYDWDRGFSGTTQSVVSTGGLYAVELYYFDNQGDQGLRLEIDGELAGPELFYRNLADYEAALAANGAAPAGGLPPVYDGPLGTTGTGLDATIRVIGEDQGLAHRVSRADIAAGAAAADAINGMIVEAIRATGAANDGVLTTAEVYDLSTYIRAHHYAAFLAAHGDDETGVETGYHLVQNDGATTRLYGENAVNTVFDGIYHIGFETEWDRFLNEDGNANARVETVAYWLNDLLKTDLANGTLENASVTPVVPTGPAGSASDPDVVADRAGVTTLATGARTLTLTGDARHGIGNTLANTLRGNALDNVLDGSAGDDALDGGDGADTLIGGRGADTMTGGRGDDAYFIDDAGDRVIENAAVAYGVDTINIVRGFTRYTLGGGVENLVSSVGENFVAIGNTLSNEITTGRGNDQIDGGAGNDVLHGGAGDDFLIGGLGRDRLDGCYGADRLSGGVDNDTYVVDNIGDVVIEAVDGGVDTVEASISWRLGATLENLVLTGTADINGYGNALANRIAGNDGNNTLDGKGGADRLMGGKGDDTYVIDNAGVVAIETAMGGVDLVRASVSVTLDTYVENVALSGAANLSATGNPSANLMRGNAGSNALNGMAGEDRLYGFDGNDLLDGGAGADILLGGLGNDRLTGGAGADRLSGEAGADRFMFLAVGDSGLVTGQRDVILDYDRAQGDRIDISAIDAVLGGADNAFAVVGGFTQQAGQLMISYMGDAWLAQGDVNGDGLADFAIEVRTTRALGATDFIL